MGRTSLNCQFHLVMKEALALGESKRDYRNEIESKKTDKIFSYSAYNSIKQTAVGLSKFIRENYPDIKFLCEIEQEHLEAFMKYKSKSCNINTLIKIKTHIESLGMFAAKKYYSVNEDVWRIEKVPCSIKANNIKVQNGFEVSEVNKLRKYASQPRRKNLLYAIELASKLGLRIDEIVTQKKSDIHIEPKDIGEFGFGYVDVSDPKHGRKRRISIISAEDRGIIKNMVEFSESDRIVTCGKENLHRGLTKARKEMNVGEVGQSWHAIRKCYAQELYNIFRQKYCKKISVDKTNEMLGHGRHQQSKLKTYVRKMW